MQVTAHALWSEGSFCQVEFLCIFLLKEIFVLDFLVKLKGSDPFLLKNRHVKDIN